MKNSVRSLIALALGCALAGCFGDNKEKETDRGGGGPAPAKGQSPLIAATPAKALEGLRVVVPGERKSEGGPVMTAGRLEVSMPSGWAAMRLGGQTKYLSPETGENLTIIAYTSEATLTPERQRDVIVALTELATKAEKVLGMFGAKVNLSPPQAGHTAWGETSTFSAIGPLNRVAFHYAAVGPHEAVMVQIDGNSEAGTPEHALALIKSVRYAEAATEKAPDGPAKKPAAPPAK